MLLKGGDVVRFERLRSGERVGGRMRVWVVGSCGVRESEEIATRTGRWSEMEPKKEPVYTPALWMVPCGACERRTWSMRLVGWLLR